MNVSSVQLGVRLFLFILLSMAALAQTSPSVPAAATPSSPTVLQGEIHGTVKSGNTALPGVSISATNTLTGKKLITSTDVEGKYSLQITSRGRYVIRAEMPAFAAVTKEAVINTTTPNATADLELVLLSRVPKTQPGENGAGMQALAGVLTGQTSQSLSLNGTSQGLEVSNSGTNDLPANENMPALANSADAANESVTVAGASGRSQDFGRDIEDIRDRIEEMRARGDFGPGGGQGGVFIGGPGGGGPGMVFMGGGPGGPGGPMRMRNFNVNRPHGSFYFSTGNSALDATPYSLSGAPGDKPDYSSYRFGGNIGGPLPKKIDSSQKTFVFLNFTGTRATQPYQSFAHVPTALERAGDFSQSFNADGTPVTFIDPATGLVTNKLSVINPTAAALLNYIPLPNQPGQQNFRFTDSADNNGTNIGFRVMRSFGNASASGPRRGPFGRNNLNFGLNYNTSSNDLFHPFPSVRGTSNSKGLNTNAGYTFSHGKFTNSLHVNFNSSQAETTNLYAGVTDIEGQLGISGVSTNSANWGLPGLSFTNFTGLTDINPVNRRDRRLQFSDTMIWRHGKHNMRFGADYRRLWTNVSSDPNPRGTFVFTGLATSINGAADTGYDLADFLSGVPQQTSIQYSPSSYHFVANGYDAFVGDDWRIRGNLTLNLGLRYEYIGPYTETSNQLVNLSAAPGFTAVVPVEPGQSSAFNGTYPASLVNPDRNNWAPRIGIAWKPFANTVVRAGYGINYNLGQYRTIVSNLAFQPPFSFTQTNTLEQVPSLTLQNGFPVSAAAVTNNYGIDPNYRLGYVQMWNLNIQRELKWNLMLNVGYTGTKGTHLDIVSAPNRGPSGLLIPDVQAFTWESSVGDSVLHAGNVRLRKRMAKGMSVGATYTFSKSIDNASSIGGGAVVVAQDQNDLAAERGLSSFNQTHKLSGDFIFELPFGEGRKWMTRGGTLGHVFGEWQLSGSYSVTSGFPFTARVLGNYLNVSQGVNGTLRANYTGAPISISDPSVSQWFNTAAFVIPTTGEFGDAGRNTIIGPTTWTFNMSLSKNFQLKDTMGLEVRADANNVFNSAQFTAIDTVVNSPTFGQVISVGSMRKVQFSVRYRF